MPDHSADSSRTRGLMRVPRSRGAIAGILLVALGVWGALIPFVGPYFDYAYTPAAAWTWTAGRFWLEILPGFATVVGGLLLLTTVNRAVGIFAGYLASLAGAWFIVGPSLSQLWTGGVGAAGMPIGGTLTRVVEQIGFFVGLGSVILFLAAQSLGRFTVRSVRDVAAAERHHAEKLAAKQPREVVLPDARQTVPVEGASPDSSARVGRVEETPL